MICMGYCSIVFKFCLIGEGRKAEWKIGLFLLGF